MTQLAGTGIAATAGVLIVTGGGRGIGAATARLAAERGYAVCVNYFREKDKAENLSNTINAKGGAIVNVSSGASRLGSPGEYVDYAASKGAVDTMTIGLAKELAEDGIRVNAVRPGFVHTEIHAAGGEPNRIERLRDSIPMKRGGEPEEVARAVLWLLSEEASYSTGAILDVTGGR
jgi:NAD(P)-dependent dehydrogenase (short-subunit alcohol dehydrogenase family)